MLTFRLDTSGFQAQITRLEKDQLPFGTSLAINRTTLKAQAAVRASLPLHFTINPDRLTFMEMMVRFDRSQWATKTQLEARFGVNDREAVAGSTTRGLGRDRSFILGRHESGGVRNAPTGQPFAIPTKNIRTGAFDLPPRNLYPTALGIFNANFTIAPKKVSRVKRLMGGKRSYFVLKPPGNPKAWGIYERVTSAGKGADRMTGVRLIWAFRTSITLPPRLHFYETAQQVFDEQWATIFEQAMDEAVRTAR